MHRSASVCAHEWKTPLTWQKACILPWFRDLKQSAALKLLTSGVELMFSPNVSSFLKVFAVWCESAALVFSPVQALYPTGSTSSISSGGCDLIPDPAPLLVSHWSRECRSLPRSLRANRRVPPLDAGTHGYRRSALRLAEVVSLFLHKCVTAFTWEPTATSGVKDARANHQEAAASEWIGVDGWLSAALQDRLLSKRLYKCVHSQSGYRAQWCPPWTSGLLTLWSIMQCVSSFFPLIDLRTFRFWYSQTCHWKRQTRGFAFAFFLNRVSLL